MPITISEISGVHKPVAEFALKLELKAASIRTSDLRPLILLMWIEVFTLPQFDIPCLPKIPPMLKAEHHMTTFFISIVNVLV